MIVDIDVYKELYRRLTRVEDTTELSKKFDVPPDTVYIIFTQKMIRMATSDHYRVKRRSRELHRRWKGGESFVDISRKLEFPAVLTALIILQEDGWSKKRFRKALNNVSDITDSHLRKELLDVNRMDRIYSPRGNEVQTQRGVDGEERIRSWLEVKGIGYMDEEMLRAASGKTPDFLLDEILEIKGMSLKWIESKATFGDRKEVNKNMKGQLVPYHELHGEGAVIYWFGITSDVDAPEGIHILTGDDFETLDA